MTRLRASTALPAALIIFIGVVYVFVSFYMPLTGDDLGYRHYFLQDCTSLDSLIYHYKLHWHWSNSRLADLLNPLPLAIMPLWANALCCGACTALMFWMIVKWCQGSHRPSLLWSLAVIAAAAFTLRWDALWMEFVTQYNYVWATAFCLAALWLAISRRPLVWWKLVPALGFCALAAGMHEASGCTAALGLVVYAALNFRRMAWRNWLMILFICGGAVFTLLAPGNYRNMDALLEPDSLQAILAGSGFYVLILAAVTLYMLIADRKRLVALIYSPWLIFALAAFSSLFFMIIARYAGRPGWFGQVFALMALVRWARSYDIHVRSAQLTKVVAIGLAVVVGAHYTALAVWQARLGTETRRALELYSKSADGTIYFDYTNEPALPWYLLRKTHGVPDADDTYYTFRISSILGGGKPFVVLPEALKNIHLQSLSEPLRVGEAIVATEQLPGVENRAYRTEYPRPVVNYMGRDYAEQSFMRDGQKFFLYSPLDRDAGEK